MAESLSHAVHDDHAASATDGALIEAALLEARAVARGICRLFARNDIWCLPET